ANDFAGFPAARALMANLASGFTMYFSPLLLLDSPWVGGALAARPNATIIQLLTEPQPGRPRAWTDQLDSFKPPYAGSAIWSGLATPIENLETREQILRWWASRISELLWIVSDPTRHVDRNGVYEPSIQFGVALTLERIFVTAVEVMCLKTKDEFIRKILLFDFLDLLQGLGMGNYERNLSHTTQHELWVLLKQTLPENVSRTFSPIIDGAFDALLQLDSGFWSAASRTPNNELLIRRKTGIGQDPISLDRARAQYVRVLRNSTHGFSDLANNPRNLSYLANHTAELDNKLPDLVWWYLIRILSNPMEISRFGGTRGN
ncbi:MAG: hypothetical protein HY050_03120, partial [Actinobacteria bacterium]|nr:hypothetical protein [Actinomycetota bacterium]